MSAIVLTTASFLLSILPPTCIQYLAFRPILQEPQKSRVWRSYAAIFVAEIVLFLAFFQTGWLEFRFLSYKKLLLSYWIPYFLAFSLISRPYAYQNLFVAGMQGIYTTTIHAVLMNLTLLVIPRSAFFAHLPIYLILYTALYVLFSPLLLIFFDRIFLKYRSLPLLAFWKYAAWLPILLSMYTGALSLKDGPLAHEYLIPHVFHILAGLFIAIIIYKGMKLIAHQVDLQRKNHLLAAQMDALSNYTSLLQDAQKRMSIFRHDSRHQLRLLSELIQQGDDEAALTFLDTLHTELQETQLQKWTKNKFINTAVSPGLERMRRAGFDVTVSLPLPQSLPFEIDLGSLMAKAIQISEQALEKQPEDYRIFFMGSHRTHDSLIIIVKHWIAEDDAAEDTDFLRYEPYGQIVPALNAFSIAYDASFRYDLKEHMVSLYLTIPYSD